MKCKKCGQNAIINLHSYNLPLCAQHFEDFFIEKTLQTIKSYDLFKKDDLIVVAVSGGKDSLALWYVLSRLGYKTHGFHVDLGIKENGYSKKSLEKVIKFSELHGLPVTVVSLKAAFGFTIDDHKRLGQRSACSTCGIIKRYLINDFTRKVKAACVATGHNLDDETAVLLGNLLNWQTGYLSRQHPKLPASSDFFASRVKPFCERSERETAAFSVIKKIDYIYDECPYSTDASTIFYKKVINEIEQRSPGTKLRFFRGFIKNKHLFSAISDQEELTACKICGQPTIASPCAFCRIVEKAKGQL